MKCFRVWRLAVLIAIVSLGCETSAPLSSHYTFEDKTVFELIEKLSKNPADQQSADLLPKAYQAAADRRKQINQATLSSGTAGDRYLQINRELQVMQKMFDAIRASPAASKAVPNPWDPSGALASTREKAAREYYAQGIEYLNYNNRPYALKAYDYFAKANNALPGFQDVKSRMAEALDKGTLKVVVNPVNYYRNTWGYWGLQEDYLQQQMVRDLNAGSFRDTRFYTDRQATFDNIRAERFVDMNFSSLSVGQVSHDRYTLKRSARIEIGQTKSIPAKPIYETVYATVTVNRSIMQSFATLDCRVYDWVTNRNILYDQFPDRYVWEEKYASFRGDRRALTSEDLAMLRATGGPPPTRTDVAQRLIRNCYSQLINRIRSGVNFN